MTPSMDDGRGALFWAAVWYHDHRKHGRRRRIADLAADAEMPRRTLEKQLQDGRLPKADHAARIARAVGMPDAELVRLLAEPVSSLERASTDRATAR